jgi:hypothetical protein
MLLPIDAGKYTNAIALGVMTRSYSMDSKELKCLGGI